MDCPSISSSLYPNVCAAALFQLRIVPVRSLLMMGSGKEPTNEYGYLDSRYLWVRRAGKYLIQAARLFTPNFFETTGQSTPCCKVRCTQNTLSSLISLYSSVAIQNVSGALRLTRKIGIQFVDLIESESLRKLRHPINDAIRLRNQVQDVLAINRCDKGLMKTQQRFLENLPGA